MPAFIAAHPVLARHLHFVEAMHGTWDEVAPQVRKAREQGGLAARVVRQARFVSWLGDRVWREGTLVDGLLEDEVTWYGNDGKPRSKAAFRGGKEC